MLIWKIFVRVPTIDAKLNGFLLIRISIRRFIDESSASRYKFDDKINSKISLWQGNITHLKIDAIVNSAKKTLTGGTRDDGGNL